MVLLCYDGSAPARRAIAGAHATLGRRRATVLHVWQPPTEFLEPDWLGAPGAPPGPPIAELEMLALRRAQAVADEGREVARGAGLDAVDARAEPKAGNVWRTIIALADDLDAELIVVGARGLSTVRSMLLGASRTPSYTTRSGRC